jgi:vacuolar-type H+-ATPase subunit H
MATEKQSIISPDARLSEQAMQRVLKAEEQANQAIKDCEQEGVQIIQEAKNRAQKISKHADNRLSHIHLRFKQCIAQQVKELRHEYAQQHQQISSEHYASSDLGEVVDRVADMLTGSKKTGEG